jgi:excisionase family DNA binding protein
MMGERHAGHLNGDHQHQSEHRHRALSLRAQLDGDRLPLSGIGSGEQVQSDYQDLNLLTANDVCALLKVKKSWLYDTVEAGKIEVIRLGKQLRFRPSAISAYLAGRARGDSTA